MKTLFTILIFFLSLAVCQAQKEKKTIGTFYFGISKKYFFQEKTRSTRNDYQITYSKAKYQFLINYSRNQLTESMILKDKSISPCYNDIGIIIYRNYLVLASTYSVYNKRGINFSIGPHIRYLYGIQLASCYMVGWEETHYIVRKTIEPGLYLNCQYFPLKKTFLRNLGLSTNVVLVTAGSNTMQMGLIYKFKKE